MRSHGLIRELFTWQARALCAVLVAACAHGLEPDRSALEGTSSGAGGTGGTGGAGGTTASTGGTTASTGGTTASTGGTTTSTGGTTSSTGGTTSSTGGTTTSTSDTTTTTTTSTGGSSSSSTTGGGGAGGAPPVGLHVQYKAADTNVSNAEIKAVFNVINDGMMAVSIDQLAIRYWYTIDSGAQTQTFFCDYAMMGKDNVVGSFGAQAGMMADHYLEVTFKNAAGMLAAGGQTGEIQARWNKTDFTTLDETNDYSFDATKLSFTDWDHVTLYLNGTLAWGIEP